MTSPRIQLKGISVGTIISLDGKTFNGNKLMEVNWNEKTFMMFTQDLRTRGKKSTDVTLRNNVFVNNSSGSVEALDPCPKPAVFGAGLNETSRHGGNIS